MYKQIIEHTEGRVKVDYKSGSVNLSNMCIKNEEWFNANVDSRKVDKIVDFESAVRIAGEQLSGFREFEFCDVMPLYIMETVSSDSGVTAPRAPGLEIEARPVYAFPEKGDLSSDEGTESIEKNAVGNSGCM